MAVLERRGRGIRHKETQLKVIMSSQHLQASPILHECEPPIKKRKNVDWSGQSCDNDDWTYRIIQWKKKTSPYKSSNIVSSLYSVNKSKTTLCINSPQTYHDMQRVQGRNKTTRLSLNDSFLDTVSGPKFIFCEYLVYFVVVHTMLVLSLCEG